MPNLIILNIVKVNMQRKDKFNKNLAPIIATKDTQNLTIKLKALYSSQNTLPKLIDDEKIKAQFLDEYYVKLQILLSENDETDNGALRDKVIGAKKLIEIKNIFKTIDTERKIENFLKKKHQISPTISRDIVNLLNEEKKERNRLELLYEKLPNKNHIEIRNIAESVNLMQADVSKVLLLGGAGVGKTTLMHYLSYKWGKGQLWNDKFDYVFRIRLKELLNENWSREYEPYELRQDKLACFIHYCLDSKNVEFQELIDNIENKNKILLLLDGYDEVAFLSKENRDYRDIMDKIFQYKNVIMTSRPNALTEEIRGRFERKIENIGWDSEGIEKYINKNFEDNKEPGTQLKSFLYTHNQIKEICEVPINTALICLVWSDKDIRDKFQKKSNENFNISSLYQEVVVWLAKKYFQKFENERITNITDKQILQSPEMLFLQELAFEALASTGKLVKNQLVKAKLEDKNFRILNIEKINKLGLLKAEGTGRNIIDLNHQFIHLTFQEYLAACYLQNQLANENTKSKAASFIGKHRNEPKYLMMLKFLAGIVSHDDRKELTEIFWEAATCNVNGVLELGIEKKIILLMHLLAQSKINNVFDDRIPNLKQIQKLIDDIILKDISIWRQHIIESGYLSEEIVKLVNEKLQNKKADVQGAKASIEIISTLANRNEWGSRTKVYKKLANLLEIEDIRLQKLLLQKLPQVLDEIIDKRIIQKSLNKMILLLGKEVDKEINIILAQIIIICPDLGKEILNQIQKKDIYLINKSLFEIIQLIPTQKAFVFLKNPPKNLNLKIKIVIPGILFFFGKRNARPKSSY